MSTVNIKDVFKVAIKIEENGKKFYEYAATMAGNKDIKGVMLVLAKEEEKHKKTFEKMMAQLKGKYSMSEFSEQYMENLMAYIEEKIVFKKEKFNSAAAEKKMDNIIHAVDFAMDREQDSITLYEGIKNIVKKEHADIVQQIIKEEQNHFLKLSMAKKLLEKK